MVCRQIHILYSHCLSCVMTQLQNQAGQRTYNTYLIRVGLCSQVPICCAHKGLLSGDGLQLTEKLISLTPNSHTSCKTELRLQVHIHDLSVYFCTQFKNTSQVTDPGNAVVRLRVSQKVVLLLFNSCYCTGAMETESTPESVTGAEDSGQEIPQCLSSLLRWVLSIVTDVEPEAQQSPSCPMSRSKSVAEWLRMVLVMGQAVPFLGYLFKFSLVQ